jgi:hypothetical protein
MRNSPPHILLTNYSMLEYLLLRPDDSPLFDEGQARWWTFLVLDEAHQYRGSRGIEMAMLLRRLKQRLREGGRTEPFRCIATSATLAGGAEDRPAVAAFASELFGEKFSEQDVILGEAEPILQPGPGSLSPDHYRILSEHLHRKGTEARSLVADLASRLDVRLPASNDDPEAIAGMLLQRDSRAATLRGLIIGKPTEVQEVADRIFGDLPEEKRVTALSELVELLLQAKDPKSTAPLLSARYHLFIRSLEGAFISYWPQKEVFLDRKADDMEHATFEVALCRECGQHYLVGQLRDGRFQEAIRDPSDLSFGATFLRPIENNGNELAEDESTRASDRQVFQLCVQCGEIGQNTPKCGHASPIRVIWEEGQKDEDKADQMAECSACGYNAAGRDPVREVVYGTDGPNAVIATTIYRSLPENRKKVLAFADSRQEAAFFAWYLEDSYRDILSRNMILRVVRRLHQHTLEGLSLRELTTGLRDLLRERKVFPPASGDLELRRSAWLRAYGELLTEEARISLEGVGLVRWAIKWPEWFQVPEALMTFPWCLSEQEARDLVFMLLDSMRADGAVELQTENNVSVLWSDLGLQGSQRSVRIGPPKGRKSVRSWDGRTGKRADLLAKFLATAVDRFSEQDALEQAVIALRAVWETFRQSDEKAPSSRDRLLVSVDDARRLNPDWFRFAPTASDDTIFRCHTCGRLQTLSVRSVCPRHRCRGRLEEKRLGDLEPNHYRLLYQEDLPWSLRVEEHTAQLDKEKAREFQREFREGKIHFLSCSTTFELGVDLGDLDTIFLRNVPPEAFNYAQRVGRAGRRSGFPGFAITYCRRGPHDLYHFSEPQRMLSGKVRPPVLSLRNEKIITRHIAATALSQFFRAPGFSVRFKTSEKLFMNFEHPSGVIDFKGFLHEHRTQLEKTLRAIVPPDVTGSVGLDDETWIDGIAGVESRFSNAEAEISSDYRNAFSLKESAKQSDDFKRAQWALGRLKDIAEEDVLSLLSRKAVIPKYGFPVDVVELDTQKTKTQLSKESREVSLQRDLSMAVAEFAPTSKIVANKKEWTSYGLKRVAGREWDRWWYARCIMHNTFVRWRDEKQSPQFARCCDRMVTTQYVDPKFGFVTNLEKPKEPKHRSTRVFTTRPYFAGFKDKEGDKIDFGVLSLTTVSPGYLVVLCEGRRGEGFYICGACGAGFRRREKSHKSPHGQDCLGTVEQVSLGHEFVTDVLQLQFHPEPGSDMDALWLAYSLAYALVEGAAEVLEVPSTDLSATVAHGEKYHLPPIVIYDNVPGGAGLVSRLEDVKTLRESLETALKRVATCTGCGENSSCYSCLRSYRNQFAHQYLQRGPVMYYLQSLLTKWP